MHALRSLVLAATLTTPSLALASDWLDTGLPWCDDTTAPSTPASSVDAACYREPAVGTFNPVVEWEWSANPTHSSYYNVMMTPVVGNITDDNGDGFIDELDVPDIVFTAYAHPDYSGAGALVAISGDDGSTHFSMTSVDGYGFQGSGGVALGDLDGDGSPEICVVGTSSTLLCLEADGTLEWAASTEGRVYAFPAIADMDGDGTAEVTLGRQIFDHQGNLLGTGAYGYGSSYSNSAISVPADMDADGELELVAGNSVYEMDGTLLWNDGGDDGFPAVADFDGDGEPEVVKVTNGSVYLHDSDGTLLWSKSPHGAGGRGGPPTIADFDGDGEPEIGIAGSTIYMVIETDGTTLWTNTISDSSSNFTGSSVYDFEGDGEAEVVYADQYTLWVFDGATGDVELELTDHSSWTINENPVIADVDADGAVEIVVAANYYASTGWRGIAVVGNDETVTDAVPWVSARPVWNQHAYNITNVNDDLSIPAVPDENWLSWNNFRAGGNILGPSHYLVDLGIEEVHPTWCFDACDTGTVDLWVPVYNDGLLDAADYVLSVYRDDGTTVLEETITTLASGAGDVLGPYSITESEWGTGSLWVELVASSTAEDCDDTDNLLDLGSWPFPGIDADGDSYDAIECGGSDCDDTDAAIFPSATDTWYDGVDSDCDGASDYDADGDGYDSDAYGGTDCDDADAAVYPGATDAWYDSVDSNCDGASDYDADGDGFDSDETGGSDCDDSDATINPDATEIYYDGVDQDCDGASDYDADGDGYETDTDCDDSDTTINPGATEVYYDGVDQDCDGASDYDADGDGYDADAHGGADCDDSDPAIYPGASDTWYDGVDSNCDGADDYDADGDGYSYGIDDCDDDDASVNPGATEVWYDGVDGDCDGNDDDQDDDGFSVEDDCDDTDAAINPDATEIWYDGVDQDCDGMDDDQDGDGFVLADDCDDTDAAINPDATEIWYDGVDDNCDGNDDDQDGDGFGVDDDCDDTDAEIYPGADGWGDDCEPITDDTGLGGDPNKDGPECGCSAQPRSPLALMGLLAGMVLVGWRRR